MNSKEAGVNMEEGEGIRTAVDLFLINNRQEALLGLRTAKVGEAAWGFPGGHQKTGETFFETASREILEELGDDVEIELTPQVVAVRESCLPPAYIPHVTVILLALYQNGSISLPDNEKNREWRWFPLDQLPENLFSKADEVVKNYQRQQAIIVTDFYNQKNQA